MDRYKSILESVKNSKKEIKILQVDIEVLNCIKKRYEINEKSLFGTILFKTGGIIIDNWLRLYGSGELDFNKRNDLFPESDIIVAEDVLGGLFAMQDDSNISYFAPDCLEWEPMEISYSEFLYWAFHGDTDTYYMDYRWNTWKDDMKRISNDNGISFYPFLWAKADSLEGRHRQEVSMSEIIKLEFDFLNQLKETK
ncbi:DUF2625 family protein [Clostridium saccharoperbutylacetonicum]|uniref:DUF2625 family protein n=1 Tax=Clostridium saccharoperbutylacetonicum TaxID=36745 RepID=UPI00098404D1|nr:DUF2625 family protein [Clostridium saccharoperbutylacetonicum]AQR96404.1 hypothetical protein CLSAP_37280 [Clostridium saccharoperbutylacetonicum]NSB32277.1 hypothetical protein [Clostridium saccharoperbutylacetonicum]